MMDELKQQFYEVMHKYQKPFSEEGVTANLTQWYEQKQGLLQLLRRHPLWNEKELAIVFRVEAVSYTHLKSCCILILIRKTTMVYTKTARM